MSMMGKIVSILVGSSVVALIVVVLVQSDAPPQKPTIDPASATMPTIETTPPDPALAAGSPEPMAPQPSAPLNTVARLQPGRSISSAITENELHQTRVTEPATQPQQEAITNPDNFPIDDVDKPAPYSAPAPLAGQQPTLEDLTIDSASRPPETPEARFAAFVVERNAKDQFGINHVLETRHPATYDTLMRRLFEAAERGADQAALAAIRSQSIAALLSHKRQFAPYASVASLQAYFEYNLRRVDVVRSRLGVEVCANIAKAGGDALKAHLQTASPEQAKEVTKLLGGQTRVFLTIISDGELATQQELTPPKSSDWRQLYRNMEQFGATPSEINLFQGGPLQDPVAICNASRHYYAALLALDGDAASRLFPHITRKMIASTR